MTGLSTYIVTSVSFGIETANAAGTGTTQPINVRLYTQTTEAFPGGTRTQIATTTANVADQANTVLNVPLLATVLAGNTQLIMEVNSPNGQVAGHSFFIGSNVAAETGPSYLSAAGCGITTPTDTAAIEAPDMNIVFNVNGNCFGVTPTPTATPTPITPTPTPATPNTNTNTNTNTDTNTDTDTNTECVTDADVSACVDNDGSDTHGRECAAAALRLCSDRD